MHNCCARVFELIITILVHPFYKISDIYIYIQIIHCDSPSPEIARKIFGSTSVNTQFLVAGVTILGSGISQHITRR